MHNKANTAVEVGDLNTDAWIIILEQGLVVIIVVGRWFMPKGSYIQLCTYIEPYNRYYL